MKKYVQKFIKSVIKEMILDGEITLTTIKGEQLEHSMFGEEYTVAHETTTLVLKVKNNDDENEEKIQTKVYGVRL